MVGAAPPPPRRGTILERRGAAYRVATASGTVRAVLRGKAKGDGPRVVVGDEVELEAGGAEQLFGITAVRPRRSVLSRRGADGRSLRPVVANVDQVVVVTATIDPTPVVQLLDRLLAIAEINRVPALVAINKVDLSPGQPLAARFEAAGYPTVLTSTKTGHGVDRLRERLLGKASVVAGPSGAGKSSLLNAVQPGGPGGGRTLRVGALSAKVRRGRQTTVSAVMLPLGPQSDGGFVIDTPGLSEVGLWGVTPGELAQCFRELRPLVERCRFGDCRHHREPECAVRQAVEEGRIQTDRYQSYLALLDEAEAAPKPWQ